VAIILANELLQRNLAKDGYQPTQHTHDLWKHDTRPISFSLVVDDFGVKYVGREHAEHCLTLEWDYQKRTVDLSMPGYIKAALHKYQHTAPTHPEHAPHTWNPQIYGAKTQYVEN
jgi:hypothetical protein